MNLNEELYRIKSMMGVQNPLFIMENFSVTTFLKNLFKSSEEKRVEETQKIVNLISKYVLKTHPLDDVAKFVVSQVTQREFFPNDSDQKKMVLKVNFFPVFKNRNVDEFKFKKQFEDYKNEFYRISRIMGFYENSPIDSKGFDEVYMRFNIQTPALYHRFLTLDGWVDPNQN